jgi:hypothetical protein
VEGFLGSDRGIKRLSLIAIADVPLEAGPVVDRSAHRANAVAVAQRYGVDWFGIVLSGELLGWAWSDEVTDAVADLTPRPFAVRLRPTDSLRDALDAAITGHTRVAPVFDGDRYLGMLSVEAISRQVTS